MPHINIEIKARCADPEKARGFLRVQNADFRGTDHQIDTYFNVDSGRLKLREGNIENYLIFYEREDKRGPKQSNVNLFATSPNSPLKEVFAKALGVLAVVDKEREIYFIDNVKFHIDVVKGLGSFMEIEAIDEKGDIGKEKLLAQCTAYLKLLGISENDLEPMSYSDLLLNPA